jgi:hypothetical protein
MKYYVNRKTWMDEEEFLFQCKMALFTKDVALDAMWEYFGSRMTRKARELVTKQYDWIEKFVESPNILTGHMVSYYGIKADKEMGMTPEDKVNLQVIGARLFSELPKEQQKEAQLLLMGHIGVA